MMMMMMMTMMRQFTWREEARRGPPLLGLLLSLPLGNGSLQQQGVLLLGAHTLPRKLSWKLSRKLWRKLVQQVGRQRRQLLVVLLLVLLLRQLAQLLVPQQLLHLQLHPGCFSGGTGCSVQVCSAFGGSTGA